MTARPFPNLAIEVLTDIALGEPVSGNWKLRKAYERSARVWFREDPDECIEQVLTGLLANPREEASAYAALSDPSDPKARLFAISVVVPILRVEIERLNTELAKREGETLASPSRAGLGDEVCSSGRGSEFRASETLKKYKEEKWRES